jgi:hypothetical protein
VAQINPIGAPEQMNIEAVVAVQNGGDARGREALG